MGIDVGVAELSASPKLPFGKSPTESNMVSAIERLTRSVNRIHTFSVYPNGAHIRGLTKADIKAYPELSGHSFVFAWDGQRATDGRFIRNDSEEMRAALESSRV